MHFPQTGSNDDLGVESPCHDFRRGVRPLEIARIDDVDWVRRELANQHPQLLTGLGREWHIGVSMKAPAPLSDGVSDKQDSARRIP